MDVRATKPQLAGREHELVVLERALGALAAGRAGIVSIVGAPGLGKSRLLEELGARAEARRWIVLAGRASEFERDLPFAPIVDALDAYLAARAEDLAPGLEPGVARRLGIVFPALADAVDQPPGDLPGERHRTHRAIGALLAKLAGERPLVLALDDLHWADDATLELVSHLVRHRNDAPVLLALGMRPSPVPATLRPALSAIARDEDSHLELRPLTRAESEAVIGDGLPADMREQIHEQSTGNPFFLQHLARAARLRADGADAEPMTGHDDLLGIPVAVATALAVEVARLPDEALTVLRGAAVAGEPFTPSTVAAVCAVAEDRVLAALDQLLDAALVQPTPTPREYRFAHPIVRRAVYDATPGGWRLAAHARAARELEARGAPASELAGHVEQVAERGDGSALAVLIAAADATAAMSPHASARWLDSALRLLPDTPDQRKRRLELLTRLAGVRAAAGQLEESRAVLDRIDRELPADLVSLRARVAASAAKVDRLLGRSGTHDALVAALEALPADAGADAAALEVELAADAFFAGDFPLMHRWVDRALAHSRRLDDRGLLVTATGLAGSACYMTGDVAGALLHLDDASAGLAALADEHAARHLHALAWFAWCEAFVERHAAAEAHVERARGLARRTGQGHVLPLLGTVSAFCALERGDLARAVQEAGVAAEEALLGGNTAFRCWALMMGCAAETAAGNLIKALEIGNEATNAPDDDIVSLVARCYRGEALIAAGEPRAGRDEILAGGGGPQLDHIETPFRPRWFAALAEAEVALGDVDAARAWAQRAHDLADASGLDGRRAVAHRARCLVAAAAGDTAAAVDAATAGVEAAQRAGLRLEAGRGLLLRGTICASAGDRDAALGSLQAAQAVLADCGAWRLRDDAAAALRRLGHRAVTPRRPGHAVGDAVLSAREGDVLDLVARGLTNRQVAAELFVSDRTVETHLAHAFGKLGVTSRAGAAAAWERERAAHGARPSRPHPAAAAAQTPAAMRSTS